MIGDMDRVSTEIAHVLFLDIVGYSQEVTAGQAKLIAELTAIVSKTPTFAQSKAEEQLLPIPTGDGMALLFFGDVAAPARCAREITLAVAASRKPLRLRMGIHSGLVQRQSDIAGKENVVGEGINTAQRVMDFADEGHILLSAQHAEWLRQFEEWRDQIHPIGEGIAKHNVKIVVFSLMGEGYGSRVVPMRLAERNAPRVLSPGPGALKLVILYKRKAQPDEQLLQMLEHELRDQGHDVFIDRHLSVGVEWAKAIEGQIRAADGVLVLASDSSVGSEMLEYEIETASDEFRRRGKPHILPIRVGSDKPLDGVIGASLNALNFSVWRGPQDDRRVLTEILSTLNEPIRPRLTERQLEPAGGAVLPDSPFYVERETDRECIAAVEQNESIVLIKGPRQMGKTSLLGRAARRVRDLGWSHALTDFQKLSSSQLGSEETFYKLLAATLGRQMRFKYDFQEEWLDVFGSNMNMDNFMRALLEAIPGPMVWLMDEADKLFGLPFASDFFGLVRSWHNSRATEPDGPWSRLTVVIAYATEAHLFIQDLNQSPFNVGRQIEIDGFTLEQTADLNERYGAPLKTQEETARLFGLIAGQPFLTRRAFDVLSQRRMDFDTLMRTAEREDGAFGDHLKRILVSVSQMPSVMEAMRASLETPDLSDSEGLHRLLSAGIVRADSSGNIVLRNELYRRYLADHIK